MMTLDDGTLALIVAVAGLGVVIFAALIQRYKMQQAIQEHAAGVAEKLITQLRAEISEARKEVSMMRENIRLLSTQLESSRIEALQTSHERFKEITDRELSEVRAEIDAMKDEKSK